MKDNLQEINLQEINCPIEITNNKILDQIIQIKITQKYNKFPIDTNNVIQSVQKDSTIKRHTQISSLNKKTLISNFLDKNNIKVYRNKEKNKLIKELHYIPYKNLQSIAQIKDISTVNNILKISSFDKFIRDNILILMPSIENHLKTALIEEVVRINPQDSFSYNNESCEIWRQDKENQKKIVLFLNQLSTDFTEYSKKDKTIARATVKYYGNIPFWILINTCTFGQVSMLLLILKKEITLRIESRILPTSANANSKILKHQTPRAAIFTHTTHMVNLRNRVSHSKSTILSKYKEIKINTFSQRDQKIIKDQTTDKLFYYLIIMRAFYIKLTNKDIKKWNNFIDNLLNELNKTNNKQRMILVEIIGLPNNFINNNNKNITIDKDKVIHALSI